MQAGTPSGPVAHHSGATRGFLFADLRGYTSFVEERGAATAAELLEHYRVLVRAVVADHEGAEIRTEGDSFYVVFPSASSAVTCALAIVDAARSATDAEPQLPIRVGVGVHAGETVETSEGFVGSAVNLAARLCGAAGPGEVLVSDTVRSLTAGVTPFHYLPAGRRRFKGIAEPVATFRATPDQADRPHRRRFGATGRAPMALVAGGGVIVLLGTSLAIASFIRGSAGSITPSPTPVTAAASAPVASAGEAADAPASASTEVTNAGREALLALVDEQYRGRCEPAGPGTLPTYVGPGPRGVGDAPTELRRDPTFSAGIICSPFLSSDPDEVAYWVVADTWIEGGAQELIINRAAVIDAPDGSCAEDRRALEAWSAGPIGGKLLCFSGSTTGATLYWVYDGADVMGRATRSDGDLDRLLARFSNEAQLRQP
jgi:class 3 adenylate cyclase